MTTAVDLVRSATYDLSRVDEMLILRPMILVIRTGMVIATLAVI